MSVCQKSWGNPSKYVLKNTKHIGNFLTSCTVKGLFAPKGLFLVTQEIVKQQTADFEVRIHFFGVTSDKLFVANRLRYLMADV